MNILLNSEPEREDFKRAIIQNQRDSQSSQETSQHTPSQ